MHHLRLRFAFLIFVALVIGIAVAFVFERSINSRFLLIAAIAAVVGYFIIKLIFRKFLYSLDTTLDRVVGKAREEYARVISLSTEDARARLAPFLANTAIFQCTPSSGQTPDLFEQLGPLTQEFFAQYREVAGPFGMRLSLDLLRPSTFGHGLVQIGMDYGDAAIVTLPGQDTIYVADPAVDYSAVASSDLLAVLEKNCYPTLYHFLLYVAESVGIKG